MTFMDKKWELLDLFIEHMNMTTMAVFISLLIGVPIGIIITRNKIIAKIVLVRIETHTFIKLEIKGNAQPDKGHPCKLGS